MSTKKRVILGICSLGLLASFIGGCHAEAKLGNAEPKAATPPPPPPPEPPPPPPPAPEPPKAAEPPKALGRVKVEEGKITITEQIAFDKNNAVIKPESFGLIDEIAKTIKENEKIKKVSIDGHTSAEGDAGANMKLSQDRAAAVLKALTERGIDKARLTSKGFGVTKPIGDNSTPTGRMQNRRVEFNIVDPAPAGGAAATPPAKK
ncbi:MAG: outer membrane protein [Labilithrix sp.]|nr:outer membrane protein [Labilithrix sp.]